MIIIGAKGFAKEVLEVLYQLNYPSSKLFFFDNISEKKVDKLYNEFEILNSISEAKELTKDNEFVLGLGGTIVREKLFHFFTNQGYMPYTLISPYAKIGHYNNTIGNGATIMTGVVITNDVIIGDGTLINLNATIGHDTKIGHFCDIMPGANISGNVNIGNYCSIGTGSVILPKIKIGNNVVVGAGAVVNKDVEDNQTVVGVPAKPINK